MTYTLMANQMDFFVFNSEMQSDCGCLSVRHDVYDNVPTFCHLYGWLDLNVPLLAELFTPFSDAKIQNIYLESDFAVAASEQPIPFP